MAVLAQQLERSGLSNRRVFLGVLGRPASASTARRSNLSLRGMATVYAQLKRIEGFAIGVNLIGPFTSPFQVGCLASRRYRAGGSLNSRLKARLNAASDS